MIVQTANARRIAIEAIADAWAPPPPVDYLAWAEQNIVFTKRESNFPGPYNRDLFPYFDEVLRALSPDDPCRIVTIAKSAQLGGTVVANIFTGGSLDMDPGDLLYVHPTENNATRWSKMKLSPMLSGTPCLRAIFPQRSRDGQDSVLYKERRDGRGAILISGANSPSALSMVTVERQVQDDLSKWEANAAGDPEQQADSRSQGREFAKIAKISTPLVQPGCKITKNYEAGSRERYYVPCPHCAHMHVLEWQTMLANLDEARPEDAHFTCPDCGGVIEEHHRNAMVRAGEWRAECPEAKRHHRSFHIWSAYSILISWERIARRWIDSKGDPQTERVFLNDVVGLAYQAKGEAPPWEDLRDRAAQSGYARGEVPAAALVLTMGIDVQKDRVEWQVVGWGRNRDRYVIEYGVIPGHISEADTQAALTLVTRQPWRLAGGVMVPVDKAAIDGNAWTADVWEWVRKQPRSRVMMVRGNNKDAAPLLELARKERDQKTGKLLRWAKRFYNFNASVLKMALYRSIGKTDPAERSYVGFPRGMEDSYFQQLTAERRVEKKVNGFSVYRWEKDPEQPNEALDTMNQAEAAALNIGLRTMVDLAWDAYEARAMTPPADVQGDLEELLVKPAAGRPAPAAGQGTAGTGTARKATNWAERFARR